MKPVVGLPGGNTDPATAPEYAPVFIVAILAYVDAEDLRHRAGIDHPATQNAAQRAHACLLGAAGTIRRAREAAR